MNSIYGVYQNINRLTYSNNTKIWISGFNLLLKPMVSTIYHSYLITLIRVEIFQSKIIL